MKPVVLFCVLALSLSTLGLSQGIRVDSPAAASRWCWFAALDIRWSKTGNWTPFDAQPGKRSVQIQLLPAAARGTVITVAHAVPNNGAYSWVIPASVPGGQYLVRVRTVDNQVAGRSGGFGIDPCAASYPLKESTRNALAREMLAPPCRIGGRISAASLGSNLAGHRVRVVLKSGGRLVDSAVYTLDAQGSCTYKFCGLANGFYDITVEKAAGGGPFASVNPCFTGTTPPDWGIHLETDGSANLEVNFLIHYALRWGSAVNCW